MRALRARVGTQKEGFSTPSGLPRLQISLLGYTSQATQEDAGQLNAQALASSGAFVAS